MKAVTYQGPRSVQVRNVPDPLAKQGKAPLDFGQVFTRGQQMGTGQCDEGRAQDRSVEHATYDYACSNCGPFEARRPMVERDQATACPGCGAGATRLLGAASNGIGAGARAIPATGSSHGRNARSRRRQLPAHAPSAGLRLLPLMPRPTCSAPGPASPGRRRCRARPARSRPWPASRSAGRCAAGSEGSAPCSPGCSAPRRR